MKVLKEFFGEHIISRPLWPSCSPDMVSPNFYLCGYVKDKVFQEPPNSFAELKEQIIGAINGITPAVLKKV